MRGTDPWATLLHDCQFTMGETVTGRLVLIAGLAFAALTSGCGGGGGGGGGGVSVPSAPSGVVATPGNRVVHLTWDATAGALSYNLYWSTSSAVTLTSNVVIGVTSPFTHDGLDNGTTYHYRLAAANDGGEGALSTEVSATPTSAPTPPAPPTGLAATAGEAQVTLAWDAAADATGHSLYWATSPGVTVGSSKIADVTGPYVHGGLASGTTYYYRLSAANAVGESGLCAEVSATTDPGAVVYPNDFDQQEFEHGTFE